MSLWLVLGPADLPVTLEDARAQVHRGDVTDDDAFLMNQVIPAATQRGEHQTHRQFIEATWDLKLDWGFPAEIVVPRPPLLLVVSITYVDPAGTVQTLAASDYQVSAPTGPRCRRGRIRPAYGLSFPATRLQMDAVTVRFKAGYGTKPADVPALLRQGILLDVGTLYEHRESVITGTIVAEIPGTALAIYRSFKSFGTS